MNYPELQTNWHNLMKSYQVDFEWGEKLWQELVRAYASPYRYYHNLGHIQQVLEQIEKMRELAQDFSAIQLAVWFHDSIYDTHYTDNEEKSANYATVALSQLKIPQTTIKKVATMILDTKSHQINSDEIDRQILVDGDLSILGASATDYCLYSKEIRSEYSWVDERKYCQVRITILHKFLERERIYYTQSLFTQLEIQARLNLQAEITALSKSVKELNG